LTNDEAINEAVFEATVAAIKDFAERRVSEGASNEQLNAELKVFVPAINQWSRRQRTLLKLMLDDPPSHALQ
jgi:uncharacterized protein YicC (UPF0701 family)